MQKTHIRCLHFSFIKTMSKITKKPTLKPHCLFDQNSFPNLIKPAMRRRVGEAGYKAKYLTCKQLKSFFFIFILFAKFNEGNQEKTRT